MRQGSSISAIEKAACQSSMGNGTLLSVTGDDLAVELLSRWVWKREGNFHGLRSGIVPFEGLNLNARFKPN